ncbi:MAG: hypothetical protein FWB86_14275 [Treponema sp.]|nr:hypothetical protein [Treponema sp.]
MKNLFKVVGIIALVAIMGFAVVACSGKNGGGSGSGGIPNGTYSTEGGEMSLVFKGNTITWMAGTQAFAESTYEIKDGKIYYKDNGRDTWTDYKLEGKNLTFDGTSLTRK